MISGAKHMPPEPFLIKEQMENLIKWYDENTQNIHPVEKAARLHIIFVGIHPFIDGNGRTSRLVLNLELMKNGYPPIVIRNENRIKYYSALDKAHTTKDGTDFIKLVVEELDNTLDLYINLIK
ncbi:Fic/DOC family protein [compost metagenome]